MKSITTWSLLIFGFALTLSGSSKEKPNSPSTNPRLTYSNEEVSAFIKLFKKEHKTKSDLSDLKQLRKDIYEQTVKIVNEGYYYSTKSNSKGSTAGQFSHRQVLQWRAFSNQHHTKTKWR